MGIRQTLNENPAITIGAASLIIVIAFAFIFNQAFCDGGGDGVGPPTREWFTTDDGQTWFADSADKIPPWQTEDGKTAVRARVFKCGDGPEFVNHMERYPDDVKAKLEAAMAEAKSKGGAARGVEMMGFYQQMEIKRPDKSPKSKGKKKNRWVKMEPQNMKEFTDIQNPQCTDNVQMIQPPPE